MNAAGVTYHWTALKAANGRMALGTYTGDGVDNRRFNVGFRPVYTMILAADSRVAVQRFGTQSGDASLGFSAGGTIAGAIRSVDNSSFYIGTANEVNRSNKAYHYVSFAATPGTITAGSYTGNGADARSVSGLGMWPYTMFVAGPGSGRSPVARFASMIGDLSAPASADAALPNAIQAASNDGFETGTDASVNAPGLPYHWVAFQNASGFDLLASTSVVAPRTNPGDTLVFTTTILNPGPGSANGVTVQNPVPANVTLFASGPSRGSYNPTTGAWSVGPLAAGAGGTLVLGATIDPGTSGATITSRAAAASTSNGEIYLPSDSSAVSVRVSLVDLDLAASASDLTPGSGGRITVSLRLLNRGPTAGSGITVTSPSGSGLTPVSHVASQGTFQEASGTWSVGALAAGDSATLAIQMSVDAPPGTMVEFTPVASATEVDPSDANNHPTLSVLPQFDRFRVVTGSYTGDGTSARRFKVTGFMPDLLLVAGDGGTPVVVHTRTMGGDASHLLAGTAVPFAGGIVALHADGFTIGPAAAVNAPGRNFTWTAFREAPGRMSVGSYVGNATDDRAITGVGFSPAYMILTGGGAQAAQQRFAAQPADASLVFDSGSEQSNHIQNFRSDGFDIGDHRDINTAGVVHHYVAWAETAGADRRGLLHRERDRGPAGRGPRLPPAPPVRRPARQRAGYPAAQPRDPRRLHAGRLHRDPDDEPDPRAHAARVLAGLRRLDQRSLEHLLLRGIPRRDRRRPRARRSRRPVHAERSGYRALHVRPHEPRPRGRGRHHGRRPGRRRLHVRVGRRRPRQLRQRIRDLDRGCAPGERRGDADDEGEGQRGNGGETAVAARLDLRHGPRGPGRRERFGPRHRPGPARGPRHDRLARRPHADRRRAGGGPGAPHEPRPEPGHEHRRDRDDPRDASAVVRLGRRRELHRREWLVAGARARGRRGGDAHAERRPRGGDGGRDDPARREPGAPRPGGSGGRRTTRRRYRFVRGATSSG